MTTTYNPNRLSPGAQRLRLYLFEIYGGDPRQLKERDKLEGQLSKLNDKAHALLQGKLYNLQKKKVGAPSGNENASNQSGKSCHIVKTSAQIAAQTGTSGALRCREAAMQQHAPEQHARGKRERHLRHCRKAASSFLEGAAAVP